MGTKSWSGRQKRNTLLPDLPAMKNGKCLVCGLSEELSAARIFYRNIHGPYNTGLPDYFVLAVEKEPVHDGGFGNKFGRPYRDDGIGRIPLGKLLDHVKENYPYDWNKESGVSFWI